VIRNTTNAYIYTWLEWEHVVKEAETGKSEMSLEGVKPEEYLIEIWSKLWSQKFKFITSNHTIKKLMAKSLGCN
jgi:hypothetical protein